MKQLLLLLATFALHCPAVSARDKRIRLSTSYAAAFNTGPAYYGTTGNFLTGQLHRNCRGLEMMAAMPVYKGFELGIYAYIVNVHPDQGAVQQQVHNYYYNPGYYNTVTFQPPGINIGWIGLEFARSFEDSHWGLTPFLRLGVVTVSGYENYRVKAHLKKKNENYYDEYVLSFKDGSDVTGFAPAFGFRAARSITDFLFVTAAASYTAGSMDFTIIEDRTNLYEENATRTFTERQSLRAFQLSIGLQLRVGRRR